MQNDEFRSVMEKVVSDCFPEEKLAFAECADELLADVAAGREPSSISTSVGEFAWADEVKAGLAAGKSILEIFSVTIALYKTWKQIRQLRNEAELRGKLKGLLVEARLPTKKVDHVVDVILAEVLKNQKE
jgi:hypothetical protein